METDEVLEAIAKMERVTVSGKALSRLLHQWGELQRLRGSSEAIKSIQETISTLIAKIGEDSDAVKGELVADLMELGSEPGVSKVVN